ncbi:MAG: hypothetical protein ACLSUQ_02310 [Monoglobus pectinilyticus]
MMLMMLKTLKKITTLTLKAKTLLTKKMILMIMKKVKVKKVLNPKLLSL